MKKVSEHSVVVNCDLRNLKSIREFISDRLIEYVPADLLPLLILAVDEVCSNVIKYSNHNDTKASLKLELDITESPSGVLFKIFDTGSYFDYQKYKEPKIAEVVEDRKKGSIGLMLVRRVMDEVEFTTQGEYNVCRLFKKINISQ